jgi:thiol-disulfide isomerase/thioredoxin
MTEAATPSRAKRRGIVFACALALAGACLAEDEARPTASQWPVEGEFPPLLGARAWLDSPPLTPASLRGKVVLVDFWTFSCINWMRTLPYVRAWASKYKDQGLVVIGVHTPEFDFEKDVANVRQMLKDMRIDYPIAIDNDYRIWNAFNNEYWPALYFIDARGRVRHHQFGEGDYGRSESVIQQLLAESGHAPTRAQRELVSVAGTGAEAPADWPDQKSPETYVGLARAENFAFAPVAPADRRRLFANPARLSLNQWSLAGDWTLEDQFARSNKPQGQIVYRFHARDLHLVMGPDVPGAAVRFRVLIDGRAPGADGGLDVDAQGNGTVRAARLYQLIRQAHPDVDRQFEIEFLDPGIRVYSFTFG